MVTFASFKVSHYCVFSFYWMEIMFFTYECGYGLEDHCEHPNHMRLIKRGCLAHFFIKRFFHHTTKYGGNHFLLSDPHLNQWKSCSWCMWPKVHTMNVNICSTCVSQVKEDYMNPITVRVHWEINWWQAQGNLVGTSKCKNIIYLDWKHKRGI